MATTHKNSVLKPVNVNTRRDSSSPARKRQRYESPSKERLSSSNIVLDDLKECGISILDDQGSPALDTPIDIENINSSPQVLEDDVKLNNIDIQEREAEISLLQASLSKDTLKKLSLGAWDEFLVRNDEPECELINYFDLLSDEMVLHIFQFLPKIVLPKITLVCQRWNRLSQDESLWARMDLSNRTIPPGCMGQILGRQVMLLKLAQSKICHPPYFRNSKVDAAEFKARCVYLDMSMVNINPESAAMIFKKCYRLKKVSLENVTVNNNVLEYLSASTELEVLNLTMAEGITLQGMMFLLLKCRKMRQLNLGWTSITAPTISYICKNLTPTMDRLNLAGCRKSITDKNVNDLVESCPNLRELDLSDCTGLTGDSIVHITRLKQLNFLALSRCYMIPCTSMMVLKKVPTLMYLDIHGGYIEAAGLNLLADTLGPKVTINKFKFSSVARPTVGPRTSQIWNMRIKDNY